MAIKAHLMQCLHPNINKHQELVTNFSSPTARNANAALFHLAGSVCRGEQMETGTNLCAGVVGCKNPGCHKPHSISHRTALPLEKQTIPQQPHQFLQSQTSPVPQAFLVTASRRVLGRAETLCSSMGNVGGTHLAQTCSYWMPQQTIKCLLSNSKRNECLPKVKSQLWKARTPVCWLFLIFGNLWPPATPMQSEE